MGRTRVSRGMWCWCGFTRLTWAGAPILPPKLFDPRATCVISSPEDALARRKDFDHGPTRLRSRGSRRFHLRARPRSGIHLRPRGGTEGRWQDGPRVGGYAQQERIRATAGARGRGPAETLDREAVRSRPIDHWPRASGRYLRRGALAG